MVLCCGKGRGCQEADWKNHKAACKNAQAEAKVMQGDTETVVSKKLDIEDVSTKMEISSTVNTDTVATSTVPEPEAAPLPQRNSAAKREAARREAARLEIEKKLATGGGAVAAKASCANCSKSDVKLMHCTCRTVSYCGECDHLTFILACACQSIVLRN